MIIWNDSITWQSVRNINASKSFSVFHATLFDICLGHFSPKLESVDKLGHGNELHEADLDKLSFMVLVEFAASVNKERKGSHEESKVKGDPHPYDVFLMKTQFGAATSKICVLLPTRNNGLFWWDGTNNSNGLSPLSSDQHLYRLASLTGSARVLECLDRAKNLCRQPDHLCKWAMAREKLLPEEEVENSVLYSRLVDPSILEKLNKSQQKAVVAVASPTFAEGFFAIQGPPGCGKTTTMVSMISAVRSGTIVTAPSNAAVGNVALKLFGLNDSFQFPRICVWGDGCDESVRFLNPRLRSDAYKRALSKYCDLDDEIAALNRQETRLKVDDEVQEIRLRKQGLKRSQDRICRELTHWLHIDDEMSMEEISLLCPDVSVVDGSISPQGRKVVTSIVAHARVVLCTLNSAGSYILQDAVSGNNFQTLFLDEGGQCTEAEFFIATTFPGIKRIIVMGDPKQLRPTVLEPSCREAGYARSWLSEVHKRSRIHLLDTQYRMDPLILQFPNNRFYGGRILSGENVRLRYPAIETPLRFLDTQGRGREERDEDFSFRNAYEIAVIQKLLKTDPDIEAIVNHDSTARIIIITPYKAQANLLRDAVASLKGRNADVSTVDAFQGQEGEVVILSTVRTKAVGFVDDSQRLNVAITRAMRVLRIVGDLRFFSNLRVGSTLRALSNFAMKAGMVQATKLQRVATSPPDLSSPTRWKITLTQRFHTVIGSMPPSAKNIALNTLFAVALPDLKALANPVAEREGWHTSWLKGYKQSRIIWVARDHGGESVVEAHFAGTRDECLRFRQLHHVAPDGCSSPRADLSGLLTRTLTPTENGQLFVSWSLDTKLQNAILRNSILDLPQSMIQLDPAQERIARAPPPLLIESRSGTGKTLVLLQHAAFYHRVCDPRPACFVTVSPRLKNDLEQKYEELVPIHGAGLPKTRFFAFRDLIDALISHHSIWDFQEKHKCSYKGFLMARKSHQKLPLDPHLVENEIGGVIMGSVVAAQQGRELSRQQYQLSKRSNISNKTEAGTQRRHIVFDEFERYRDWKTSENKYDIHDAVLRLLLEPQRQVFSSAYLDEIQDLSHAAIYFICGIAGKDHHHWVCGGDPAQMISSGCSFTFDGLKQTLLSLEAGIEKKLKKVEHLLVNYRTTKDILMLGNQILSTAKRFFPGAIDFARPERARKDLGLKVALCNWETAFKTTVNFGDNQAFIYSSVGDGSCRERARIWLDDHPFILSSLDSKGLEFDDVVVAFEYDRKVWQVERKLEVSLAMLRELYVAVTRAQRRVVILIDEVPAMDEFFKKLGCDYDEESGTIFMEFNCNTSTDEWFERAKKQLEGRHFGLASSCFIRAERQDWSFLARGHGFLEAGDIEGAEREFRKATRIFYEGHHYEEIVHLLSEVLEMKRGSWNQKDDEIFLDAIAAKKHLLPRAKIIRFAILRQDFSSISLSDLKSRDLASHLMRYREESWLMKLVADCSDDDRDSIASVMPVLVFDYHLKMGHHHLACKTALLAGDYASADVATAAFLGDMNKQFDSGRIMEMVYVWNENVNPNKLGSLSQKSPTSLLFKLFQSPKQLSSTMKANCTMILGKEIVLLSVDKAQLERTVLLEFGVKEFKVEVHSFLRNRFSMDLVKVVKWYGRNGHPALATDFVKERMTDWSNVDFLRVSIDQWGRPKWLLDELERRHLVEAAVVLIVLSPYVSQSNRAEFIRCYMVAYPTSDDSHGHGGLRNAIQAIQDKHSRLKQNSQKGAKGKVSPNSKEFRTDSDKSHEGKKSLEEDIELVCRQHLKTVLAEMSSRGLLLEKAFVQIWVRSEVRAAIQCAWKAIETHQLASSNIIGLFKLWKEVQQENESQLPRFPMEKFGDRFTFIMCLFFSVSPDDTTRKLFNGIREKFTVLLLACGPTAAAYCRIHCAGKSTAEEDALLERLRSFHCELRCRILDRLPPTDQHVERTKEEGQEAEIVGLLSNKEARKLKQAARRQESGNSNKKQCSKTKNKKRRQKR